MIVSQLRNVDTDLLTKQTTMRAAGAVDQAPDRGGLQGRLLGSLIKRQQSGTLAEDEQKLLELLQKEQQGATLDATEKAEKQRLESKLGAGLTTPKLVPLAPKAPPATAPALDEDRGAFLNQGNFSTFASLVDPLTTVAAAAPIVFKFFAEPSAVAQEYTFELPAAAQQAIARSAAAGVTGPLDMSSLDLQLKLKSDRRLGT